MYSPKAGLLCLLVFSTSVAFAQNPDVIVGDLPNVSNYGSSGNIAAFAVGTTSCNIGTDPLSWVSSTNQHPVIAQNMYRIKDGRFEQVGMSWLKHGFLALAGSLCDSCQNPGTGSLLGVGCSDPYSSGLNGSQSGLGPRFEVNADTGAYPYPFTSPTIDPTIGRRLQVHHSDLDPAQNAGASYFVEGHYVTPDDAAAGNHDNNASYRAINVSPNGSSYNIAITGATVREKAAIWAWAAADPDVTVQNVDVPGDGRFIIGVKEIDLGGGMKRYNYALHNLNSDRSARSFAVAVTPGASLSNFYFNDVDYHSGEPFSGTDWSVSSSPSGPSWSTQTFGANPNANALRWGTCYSFGFDTNGDAGAVTIGLFKPGSPSSVTVDICPPQPQIPVVTGGYMLNTSAAYDYVNLTSGQAGPTGDDQGVLADLGFSFTFFGMSYTQMVISSNGYLAIPGQSGGVYSNAGIPSGGAPNGIIAGFWDDLNPSAGGTITYDTVGTAPNRRFVVDYDGVFRFNTTDPESFQIILEEGGDIVSTIVSSTSGGASATRGIEDQLASTGVQFSLNSPGSAVGTTTIRYEVVGVSIPETAVLTQSGDGSPFSFFGLGVLSTPNSPLFLVTDSDAGPTQLGPYGSLDIGFSAGYLVIADGIGITGPPNPSAVTDHCGQFMIGASVGPLGFPSGLTLHFQAIISDFNAPNGFFHISNPVTFIAP